MMSLSIGIWGTFEIIGKNKNRCKNTWLHGLFSISWFTTFCSISFLDSIQTFDVLFVPRPYRVTVAIVCLLNHIRKQIWWPGHLRSHFRQELKFDRIPKPCWSTIAFWDKEVLSNDCNID